MSSFYRRLLALYPKAYQEKYADQMLQTLADMLDDQPTGEARMRVLLRASIDLPLRAVREHVIMGGTLMNVSKKLTASLAWIAVAVLAYPAIQYVRGFGTTWMNEAGGLRVLGLALMGVAFMVVPVVLAVLVWFDQPKGLYRKFAGSR